jgi:hypothetical protein
MSAQACARGLAALCLSLWLPGCVVQGGWMASAARYDSARVAASWGGHAVVAHDGALRAGLELEGRAVHARGSLFGVGLQLGKTLGDDRASVRLGAHLDGGFMLGWSAAFALYGGATLELPVRLTREPPITERNRNFRLVGGAPWLVPFLRYRHYALQATDDDIHDFGAGLALRMSYTSDLL